MHFFLHGFASLQFLPLPPVSPNRPRKEVREFLQKVIKEHAMEESLEDAHCPARPITHAFLLFNKKNWQGSKCILRLPSWQQYAIEQRTLRFRPDLNLEERFLQNSGDLRKIASTQLAKYRWVGFASREIQQRSWSQPTSTEPSNFRSMGQYENK